MTASKFAQPHLDASASGDGLLLTRRTLLSGAAQAAAWSLLPATTGPALAASPAALPAGLGLGVDPLATWPVRSLLAADLSRSRDRRNLVKPVLARRLLDDMEQDAWAAKGGAALSYTRERARTGSRSLRFSADLRPEAYLRSARSANGSFNGHAVLFEGMPFAAGITRRFDQPQDWRAFNRLSIWCFVHPANTPVTAFALKFLCEGAGGGPSDPIAIHYFCDFRPGEWQLLAWEIPEQQRDRVIEVSIFQPITGVAASGAPSVVTYDFDELCVERVDAEPVAGWQVTPGKIAYSHVGYELQAQKIAVSGEAAGSFALIEADGERLVASFKAQAVHNRRGHWQVLDFSSFDKQGRFRLRHGAAVSEPFDIGGTAWRTVTEATLNAFYGLRCGCKVPGVHEACHLDVFSEYQGERRPVGGGWHDAANLTQGPYRTHLSSYALLELHDALHQRGDAALADRALEEALWGLDWSLRLRFAPGIRTLYGDYSFWTDGIPGTLDDVVQSEPRTLVGRDNFQNTLAALATARAARSLLQRDAALSLRLLKAAREDFADVIEHTEGPPKSAPPLAINEPSWRDQIGYLTLAAVELFRATGEQAYAQEAVRLGRWLQQTQERRFVDGSPVTGYFYEDAGRTRIVHEYHNGFEDSGLLAFAALTQALPEHPEWMDWYAGLVLYAEHFCIKGAEASAPFDVIPAAVWRRADIDAAHPSDETGKRLAQRSTALFPTPPTDELVRRQMTSMFEASAVLSPDQRLRVFPLWYDKVRHGASNVHLGKSIGLAAAAAPLQSPECSDLAARQLQWLLGTNPFSRSLIYGVGQDWWQNFCVELPNLVGGMSLGFNAYQDDAPAWGNNAVFPYKEMWVFSSCKVAHGLALVAAPAHVEGHAPAGATLENLRTGRKTRLPPGRFSMAVESGHYAIHHGKQTHRLALAAGSRRKLALDGAIVPQLSLHALAVSGARRELVLTLRGSGQHRLAARLFNAELTGLPASVEIGPEGVRRLRLVLQMKDLLSPWRLMVVPDEQLADRAELAGTYRKPGRIA